MRVSRGFGERRGAHPRSQGGERGKQGDGQLRGARCGRRRAPACLPGQAKQLAGAVAGLGRQVGLWVAPGKSFPFFLFLFLFCKFVEFLKIPRQLQNSPNCTWSLVGIFPARNILVWVYLSIKIFL